MAGAQTTPGSIVELKKLSLEELSNRQNLLHDRHVEFGDRALRGEIERGVYARFAWGF